MNKLKCILLLSGLLGVMPQTFAAITYVSSVEGATASNTVSATLGEACPAHDLLIATLTPVSGITPAPTYTVTDNVDVGAWNKPAALQRYDSSPQFAAAMFWIACDTGGTAPTVTVSGFTGQAFVTLFHYTGFPNGPSLVAADVTSNPATGSTSSTSPAATALTNSDANELIVGLIDFFSSGGNISSPTGSLTVRQGVVGGGGIGYGDVVETSAGSTINFGATLGGATNWVTWLAGFVDSGGGSCTHAGITSAGAIAIPNGTSGSYQGKSGAFVTPDCSTVEYKCPTLGNFCTN